MSQKANTIGKLIEILQKLPPDTPFFESTQGHYSVKRECYIEIIYEIVTLTRVGPYCEPVEIEGTTAPRVSLKSWKRYY